MQGDPSTSCITVSCQTHDDCGTEEICGRLSRVCAKACTDTSCGPGAECIAKDHVPECTCPEDMEGNPYIQCVKGVVEKDSAQFTNKTCRVDFDCADGSICSKRICVDPCVEGRCGGGQECQVVNGNPMRTIICKCPVDSFVDKEGICTEAGKISTNFT